MTRAKIYRAKIQRLEDALARAALHDGVKLSRPDTESIEDAS